MSLGHRPRNSNQTSKRSAESALQSAGIVLNPKHSARRNQRRACATVRDIPPETSECDDTLVGLLYGRNVDLASPFAKGRG